MVGERKRIPALGILLTVLFVLCLASTVAILALYKMSPRLDDARIINTPPSYYLSVGEDPLIADVIEVLNSEYTQKLSTDSIAVREYEERVAADTEAQRQQAALRAQAQKEFFDRQTELQQRLEELRAEMDARAQYQMDLDTGAMLPSMGLTVIPDGYYDQEQIVGGKSDVEQIPIEGQQPAVIIIDTKEKGQFEAQFVCTCASCFDPVTWPKSTLATSAIFADSNFLKPGSTVELSAGWTKPVKVYDAEGELRDRKVILFHATHDDSLADKRMYVKINEI